VTSTRAGRAGLSGNATRAAASARALSLAAPGCPHLDAPCRRTLSLVWRADAYRPAAARALTEFAAGYFRTWRGDA